MDTKALEFYRRCSEPIKVLDKIKSSDDKEKFVTAWKEIKEIIEEVFPELPQHFQEHGADLYKNLGGQIGLYRDCVVWEDDYYLTYFIIDGFAKIYNAYFKEEGFVIESSQDFIERTEREINERKSEIIKAQSNTIENLKIAFCVMSVAWLIMLIAYLIEVFS